MPHEIDGQRFFGRQPGWHRLGTVADEDITAEEAFALMGAYHLELVPIPIIKRKKQTIKPPFKTIVRLPTDDRPDLDVFGVVSNDYVLITPQRLVDLWDQHVQRPVETMGALRKGRILFITTALPTFDVKGDEVKNYLMARNGMDGSIGCAGSLTPVRTVCMNTLILGEEQAIEGIRLVHNAKVEERLAAWLKDIVARAERQAAVLKETFEVLAAARVNPEQATAVLKQTYPDVPQPRVSTTEAGMRAEMAWLKLMEYQTSRRTAALDLFLGAGTGMDTRAAAGTAFGLYNAVVEREDYGASQGTNTAATTIAYEALFGERAKAKERAFELCLDLARN